MIFAIVNNELIEVEEVTADHPCYQIGFIDYHDQGLEEGLDFDFELKEIDDGSD